MVEVSVTGTDGVAVGFGPTPDGAIGGTGQAEGFDVGDAGVEILQRPLPDQWKGFDRAGASQGDDFCHVFTLGGPLKAGKDILMGKFGEMFNDLVFGHAAAEVVQDITDGQPGSLDTGFAGADAGADGDAG